MVMPLLLTSDLSPATPIQIQTNVCQRFKLSIKTSVENNMFLKSTKPTLVLISAMLCGAMCERSLGQVNDNSAMFVVEMRSLAATSLFWVTQRTNVFSRLMSK